MNKYLHFTLIIISSLIFFACKSSLNQNTSTTFLSPTPTFYVVSPIPTQPVSPTVNPACSWIDQSDLVINLKFAPGVIKDTSYEAGFTYRKPTNPNLELRLVRLARGQCDYRVGFSRSDFDGIDKVGLAVWSYTGSIRQKIKSQSLSADVINGLPVFSNPVEIEIEN